MWPASMSPSSVRTVTDALVTLCTNARICAVWRDDDLMISLHTTSSHCVVDPDVGARLTSLVLGRHDLLKPSDISDPTQGGCFPMVPWAGRLRNGTLVAQTELHTITGIASDGVNPLHGTVADRAWTVVSASTGHVWCRTDLGHRWPYAGTVDHVVALDARGVTCTLTLTAGDEGFPAQVGWHPWFRAPWQRRIGFRHHYQRDHQILPTGVVEPWPATALDDGPFDDCFWGPLWTPELVHPDGSVVEVSSDCSHWGVYDAPDGARCLEPQSGPPDGATIEPLILPARTSLRRWMRIAIPFTKRSVTVQ
jgi:aldose 1-epimerase